MQGPSKVIVLDPDARSSRQIQLGFEREGIPTLAPAIPSDLARLEISADLEPGLCMVGGSDKRGLELVSRARQLMATVPIVFTGRGASRKDVEAAGGDEMVTRPAYLRDVVTIGRIMRGVPPEQREHFVGSLVETTGVYTLSRAFVALGRSGVLTLIRGLRRGEIRFYRGEVTSAQVGLIHGQAAFHQLLLWTDARFDFAYEDVVRRQQIPLTPDEMFADAERFLEGVRESAELLSPALVLEVDMKRVQLLGKQIPTEVHGVLRMFDGHRVLADILEDSPYRVFETLRVAQKAVEAGLLRTVEEQRPKTTWRAVLALEEWLVGNETRDAVVERTAKLDSGPISTTPKKFKKGKRRKKRSSGPPQTFEAAKTGEIDWGALVPRTIGAEVGPLSGVVPAAAAHGEIEVATRDAAREKLEALMDTDKRDKIFPKEIGLEPSVVIRSEDTDEWERLEIETRKRVASEPAPEPETVRLVGAKAARAISAAKAASDAEAKTTTFERADADSTEAETVRGKRGEANADAKAKLDAKADADAKAKADAEAKAKADAEAKAKADADAKAKTDADAEAKAKADADAKLKSDAEAKTKADADAKAKADADAKARADAEAKAKADADAKLKADAEADAKLKSDAEAKAKADADVKAKADADAKARADADAKAKADADAKLKADADAKLKADADAKAKADADAKAKADADAKAKADADAKAKADADAKAKADADAKAKADADAKAKADADAKAKADADAKAKADADAKAKADADAKAKADADAKLKADADAKAKADTDANLKADAEAKAKANADAEAKPKADADAKAKADADAKLKADADAKAKADADAKAKADADAEAKAKADAKAAEEQARAEATAAAEAKARAGVAEAKARAEAAEAKAKTEAKAKAEAEALAAAEAKAKADSEAKAKADAVTAAEAKAKADAEADAKAKADADGHGDDVKTTAFKRAEREDDETAEEARAWAEAAERAKAASGSDGSPSEDGDDARAWIEAATRAKESSNAEAAAAVAIPRTPSEEFRVDAQARVRESVERMRIDRLLKEEQDARRREQDARSTAADEAKQYAARVKAAAEARREEAERAAAAGDGAASSGGPTTDATGAPQRNTPDAAALVRELVSGITPESTKTLVAGPITVAETDTSTVTLADKLTVVGKADTAVVTATPQISVHPARPSTSPPAPSASPLVAAPIAAADAASASPLVAAPVAASAAPLPADDEPSDGIVRSMIAVKETERLARQRRRLPSEPESDGPPVKETRGEISQAPPKQATEVTQEPSILVADLAAAHTAIAAVAAKAAAQAPTVDAASASKELMVSEVRRDAVAFTQEEEAFFKNDHGAHTGVVTRVEAPESFDDLDEGYEPPKFWDRVWGRKRNPSDPPPKKG